MLTGLIRGRLILQNLNKPAFPLSVDHLWETFPNHALKFSDLLSLTVTSITHRSQGQTVEPQTVSLNMTQLWL